MDILVGFTGFVGQNLYKQHRFDAAFNSKNITDAYGTSPDLCVYSGVRAEKFVADSYPDEDLAHINEAITNICKINPKRLVLISTVDVISSVQPADVYEDTEYVADNLTPYGRHRLFLENQVRDIHANSLVVRLPALFGQGLKKNFIFDLINFIPAMLRKSKFDELNSRQPLLANYYHEDANGFLRLKGDLTPGCKDKLKDMFRELGFSALGFTDSRSMFSFYNLDHLWGHIKTLVNEEARLAHLANEPITASEIYQSLYGSEFINLAADQPFDYSFFKTRYARLLGASNDNYISGKETILSEIIDFIKGGKHALH